MKRLIIAALVLIGFSAAVFAQTVPVKNNEPSRMQVVKKATDEKEQTKVMIMNKDGEGIVTFTLVVTIIIATVFFVSFFAGVFYATGLVAECVAGLVALFIGSQIKAR